MRIKPFKDSKLLKIILSLSFSFLLLSVVNLQSSSLETLVDESSTDSTKYNTDKQRNQEPQSAPLTEDPTFLSLNEEDSDVLEDLELKVFEDDSEIDAPININESANPIRKRRKRGFKEFIKGYRPDDAILLGMWSFHFDGEGEFSKHFYGTKDARNHNEVNNLVGIQYASICAATFTNSHDRQTFVLGVNRNLIDKKIGQTDLHFQSGYRAGIIYGYGDQFPNLGGVSPVLFLTAGLKYKIFGVELNYVPGTPVPGLITRINLAPIVDKFNRSSAKKI
ncbi:MAG: hypothetical protein SFU25_02040 [Candidatus Caenarcaniphilales bacterium]|nr:hypothetical protein [Candidatus Caenarcaniphilales bacterium]